MAESQNNPHQSNLSETEQRAKLFKLIEDIDFGMLTTADAKQTLTSRPMSTREIDAEGGILWFFTSRSSHKVADVNATHAVNIGYSHPNKNSYVSVAGTAEIVGDRNLIKAKWDDSLKVWFPNGVEDPDVVLLKVKMTSAEYWDSTSSRMVMAYHAVKAFVTGTEYSEGENERVQL